jgi:hypothetical protein
MAPATAPRTVVAAEDSADGSGAVSRPGPVAASREASARLAAFASGDEAAERSRSPRTTARFVDRSDTRRAWGFAGRFAARFAVRLTGRFTVRLTVCFAVRFTARFAAPRALPCERDLAGRLPAA